MIYYICTRTCSEFSLRVHTSKHLTIQFKLHNKDKSTLFLLRSTGLCQLYLMRICVIVAQDRVWRGWSDCACLATVCLVIQSTQPHAWKVPVYRSEYKSPSSPRMFSKFSKATNCGTETRLLLRFVAPTRYGFYDVTVRISFIFYSLCRERETWKHIG